MSRPHVIYDGPDVADGQVRARHARVVTGRLVHRLLPRGPSAVADVEEVDGVAPARHPLGPGSLGVGRIEGGASRPAEPVHEDDDPILGEPVGATGGDHLPDRELNPGSTASIMKSRRATAGSSARATAQAMRSDAARSLNRICMAPSAGTTVVEMTLPRILRLFSWDRKRAIFRDLPGRLTRRAVRMGRRPPHGPCPGTTPERRSLPEVGPTTVTTKTRFQKQNGPSAETPRLHAIAISDWLVRASS